MSKDTLVATRCLNDDDNDQHICRKAQDKLKAAAEEGTIASCVRTSEMLEGWSVLEI